MRWTVVIPEKALPAAKSRLAGASADPAGHARLVEAIRADTLDAVEKVPDVARVVVVADRPTAVDAETSGRHVFVQRSPGLNAGLSEAADHAQRSWPADAVVVLVADLPALRAEELRVALAVAGTHRRAFVADADGTGTTLLAVAPGVPLAPEFGAGSAHRHAVAARAIDAGPGLRRDVDTAADLQAAAELGVGARTAAVLAAAADTPSSTSRGMMHDMSDVYGPEA